MKDGKDILLQGSAPFLTVIPCLNHIWVSLGTVQALTSSILFHSFSVNSHHPHFSASSEFHVKSLVTFLFSQFIFSFWNTLHFYISCEYRAQLFFPSIPSMLFISLLELPYKSSSLNQSSLPSTCTLVLNDMKKITLLSSLLLILGVYHQATPIQLCKELIHWKDPDAGKDWRQKQKGWQRMRWLDSITDSMDINLSKP